MNKRAIKNVVDVLCGESDEDYLDGYFDGYIEMVEKYMTKKLDVRSFAINKIPLPDLENGAMCFCHANGNVDIVYDEKSSPAARRYLIAHELAHLVLHVEKNSDGKFFTPERAKDELEDEASYFAELLLKNRRERHKPTRRHSVASEDVPTKADTVNA